MVDMSKIYIGYVVEVIKDINEEPTFELRVRIPTVHGVGSTGLPDSALPIAKPLVTPGTVLDKYKFSEFINNIKTAYIIFDKGNLSTPVYIGLQGDQSSYDMSGSSEGSVNYSHNLLTIVSRGLSNQHPIESITGLKEKIDYHIGDNAPEELVYTWFQTISENPSLVWDVELSSFLVELNETHTITWNNLDLVRLIVTGNVFGEDFEQEFHNVTNKINGEAIILIEDGDVRSAEIEITLYTDHIEITGFTSTGSTDIVSFYALRLEVYR